MRSWSSLVALLAVQASHTTAAPTASKPDDLSSADIGSIDHGMHLKIMPFGASITWGTDSTDHNGYREHLKKLLEKDGNEVTYVGTKSHGSAGKCEAIPGYTIKEMDEEATKDGAFKLNPNVYLIHLGTNNCHGNKKKAPKHAAQQYTKLLKQIKEHDPDALVLASNLIENLDPHVNYCIKRLNRKLKKVVKKAKKHGQKVATVDMFDAMPARDIIRKDKTHPDNAGYELMAHVWYKSIVENSRLISAAE